jgi:hypothetical protein
MPDINQSRTIATAPRDGTRVLVYVPAEPGGNEWDSYRRGWLTAWFDMTHWYTGLRDTCDSAGALDEPSHWLPLPAEPSE